MCIYVQMMQTKSDGLYGPLLFMIFFLLELVPNHVFIFTKRFWIFLDMFVGPILEGKGRLAIFSEKGQKKGKNKQNLKIF